MTPEVPLDYPSWVRFIFGGWNNWGWVGVDLFFVLSGFLVSGLLIREYERNKSISFRLFFIRRGLKIYPAFFFFIAVYGLLEYNFTGNIGFKKVIHEIFFLQNYLGGVWNHTWTLAVEEHFYLFIGILLTFMAARYGSFHLLVKLFFVIAVLCLLGRIVLYSMGSSGFYVTHTRMDSLMFGVFICYLNHYRGKELTLFIERRSKIIVLASLLMLTPLWFTRLESSWYLNTIGLTINYVAFGAILLVMLNRSDFFRHKRFFSCSPLLEFIHILFTYGICQQREFYPTLGKI